MLEYEGEGGGKSERLRRTEGGKGVVDFVENSGAIKIGSFLVEVGKAIAADK